MRVVARTFPVAGDEPRLHRTDRPPPALRRRAGPALAIALRSSREPGRRFSASTEHEKREPGRPGRVPHPRELPLTLVRIFRQARGAVLVSFDRSAARSSQPSGHARSIVLPVGRELREVVYVDGVRTAFGRAGEGGYFCERAPTTWPSRSCASCSRRNPTLPPERIDDVVIAATAQVGDQGLTLGRDVALLAGLPKTVPGFAVDRMCAGALTATTAGAGEIAMGAADVVLVGGVEHMGHHPMGADVDFNPRFVAERIVDESAAVMGQTAENLHDAFPS